MNKKREEREQKELIKQFTIKIPFTLGLTHPISVIHDIFSSKTSYRPLPPVSFPHTPTHEAELKMIVHIEDPLLQSRYTHNTAQINI